MPVETDTERAIFVDSDDFGVACTYTRDGQGSPEPTLYGIFDNEYIAVGLEGSTEIASTDPVFMVESSKLHASHAVGDQLVISAVTYKARVFQPDGTGMTVIVLEEQ